MSNKQSQAPAAPAAAAAPAAPAAPAPAAPAAPAPTTHNNEIVDILDRVFDNSHRPQHGGDVHGESLFDIPTYVRSSSSPPAAPSTPTTKSFIDSLSQKERKAYVIAENFLETSFDLKKSIGFKKWWLTKST